MKSTQSIIKTELVINKSTFINYLIPVKDLENVHSNLTKLRKEFSDASHHCFAYILGKNQGVQKYSDDGEPSKTAGYPMMEVLKKHNLTNILNVSIRYFGGIKLGSGGLVRAYTKSCANGVAKAEFSFLETYCQLVIEVPFHHIGNVEKYIRDNFKLLDTNYGDYVSYIIEIKKSLMQDLKMIIANATKGQSHCEVIQTFERYE